MSPSHGEPKMTEKADSLGAESSSGNASPVAVAHTANGPVKLKSSLSRAFLATGMPIVFQARGGGRVFWDLTAASAAGRRPAQTTQGASRARRAAQFQNASFCTHAACRRVSPTLSSTARTRRSASRCW